MKQLIEAGRRIGDVASLSLEELSEFAREDEAEAAKAPTVKPAIRGRESADGEYLQACIAAVERLDGHALENALREATLSLSAPLLRQQVLIPLLNEVGYRWQHGQSRIVHEHLATSIVRAFLDTRRSSRAHSTSAPRIIVATVAGDRHELGALFVAAVAEAAGWDVVYLGPDLPAEEIAAAAREVRPQVVAVSIVYAESDVRTQLRKLREYLPSETIMMAGGRGSAKLSPFLDEIGVLHPDDLTALAETLPSLNS
jgi:methanogenic corrinoid protein MtbC1